MIDYILSKIYLYISHPFLNNITKIEITQRLKFVSKINELYCIFIPIFVEYRRAPIKLINIVTKNEIQLPPLYDCEYQYHQNNILIIYTNICYSCCQVQIYKLNSKSVVKIFKCDTESLGNKRGPVEYKFPCIGDMLLSRELQHEILLVDESFNC